MVESEEVPVDDPETTPVEGVGNLGLDPEQDEYQPPEEPEAFDDLQGDVTGETVTPDFESEESDEDDEEVKDEPDTGQGDGGL